MMEAPYTRLYVDSDIPLLQLRARIARAVSGNVDLETVVSDMAEIDVRPGDSVESDRDPTDFIYYRYSVEVEAKAGIALERYLDVVATIMHLMSDAGANVVASCDWEDELPGSGKLGSAFS